MIYTSGSTGLPKGVMIDHRGAVNTVLDVNQRFGINSRDKVLALSELNFDLSVYDIFGTLAAGATIVLPEEAEKRNPARWLTLVEEFQITVWNSVPILMEMFVEYIVGQHRSSCYPLRLVLLSGDWLPIALVEQIKVLRGDVQVVSMGGATEASIWSIVYPIEGVNLDWKSIPYGKPMTNQRFYVLNEKLEPCPVWVPGQLYIGGIGLAKGYWRDSEKSSVSFFYHPRTGERLYRTGDIGRWLPEGNIEFLGREDFQVKLQGHRIELGEIEATLVQHEGVSKAVVILSNASQRNKRLVAYIVPDQGLTPTGEELQSFLRERLPEYMVPFVFMTLNALPLTPNGKVNRKALPDIHDAYLELNATYAVPQSEMEQSIAACWQEVLGIQRVGIHDNFFDLGGNSLHIVQIYNRLQKVITGNLMIVDMFKYPTVRTLAQFLDQGQEIKPSMQQVHSRAERQKAVMRRQKKLKERKDKP